jgi:hypothetical protein
MSPHGTYRRFRNIRSAVGIGRKADLAQAPSIKPSLWVRGTLFNASRASRQPSGITTSELSNIVLVSALHADRLAVHANYLARLLGSGVDLLDGCSGVIQLAVTV